MTTVEPWPGVAESSLTEGKPVVPLTEDQQRLAGENIGLAYDVVFRHQLRSVRVRIAVEKLGEDRAVSEALYGLVMAARGYKADRGFKFSTYAYKAMVLAVIEAGNACGRLTERSLNGKVQGVPFLTQFGGEGAGDFSQEAIPDGSEEEEPLYSEEEVKALRRGISLLPEKERVILVRRFFNKETLVGLGKAMGVSREAIRQVQERALARLRKMLMGEE